MNAAAPPDPDVVDAAGLAEVLDRSQELLHESPVDAERLATLALHSADHNGLDEAGARARYLLARLKVVRGELQTALDLIDEARARWLAAGDQVSALRTDLGRMQVLDDLGRHADAAAVGAALLAAVDELEELDAETGPWLRAAALENYGVASSYVGEHDRAIDAYEQAERTYAALGRDAERARPMANRAVELLGLGRAREALDVFAAAADTFEQSGDRLWAAKCRGDLARAHRQLGQYPDALRVLAQARSTLDELGASAELARLQLAVATTYLEIGVYDAAIAEAISASELTRAAGMLHDTATAQFTLALAHAGSGSHARASVALDEAAALFEQVGDRRGRTELRLVEAELAAADGHPDRAAASATLAVEESRAGGWPALLARALICQSDVYDGSAARALAEAEPVVAELGLPVLSYELDLRRARRELAAGRTGDGELLLRRAIGQFETLGGNLPDHMLRRAFRARTGTPHDELVDLLVTRDAPGDHAEAARIADTSKSHALRIHLGGDGATSSSLRGGQSSDMSARQVDLNATYLAMADATNAAQRRRLHERATDLQQQITALRLREIAALPSTNRHAASTPLSEHDETNGTTLAFHVVGDDVIAFVSRGDQLEVRRLGAVKAVDRQLELLAAQWARFHVGSGFVRRHANALLATSTDVLSHLHALLLAPVVDLLGDLGADELVVVPHRQLCNVPFHALYDNGRPLIERWAISVAPTRDRLPGLAVAGDRTGALVLAVPDERAPAVAAEAAAVAATLPNASVLTGAAATSEALARMAPTCGILHVACHGLFRSESPMFSALRLADRWVTAAELAELDLRGTLVVLSACETGRQDDASEPVGLAWALLAAGASGVVVSRWVVEDEGAATLMGDMHRHLSAGQAPASALREAQLAAESRTPHPFHWAPFSYVTSMRGER